MTQEKLAERAREFFNARSRWNRSKPPSLTEPQIEYATEFAQAELQKAAEIADRFNGEAGLEIRKLME